MNSRADARHRDDRQDGRKEMDLRLSVVTPVYEPDEMEFRLCISSMYAQTFKNWQWILVDDGSPTDQHFDVLKEISEDPRLTVIFTPVNSGIAKATNRAIESASGEFICFLDQDDMLQVNALEEVEKVIQGFRDVDVIYTDEDKIDSHNQFFSPFSKPTWSPERFRHQNYLNHLTVIRKEVIERVGGLRTEFDGSQDYDLLLRATEVARRIVHIPEVLYHWRAGVGSVASSTSAKPQANTAAVAAVQEHLEREGISGTAVGVLEDDFFHIAVSRGQAYVPSVSIIIPTRGSIKEIGGLRSCLVENCIESLLCLTDYPDMEIIVVVDSDSSKESWEYLKLVNDHRLSIVEFTGDFNFSKKINLGALRSSKEIILPLNDDVQVIDPSWLLDLVAFFEEDDVGAVAPILLLESGHIQSAGHVFGNGGVSNAYFGAPADHRGAYGVLSFPSERSGLSFAAIALRRQQFLDLGGLSEDFPAAFNDVDFCTKLLVSGYRLICTGKRSLHHFESLTRDPTVTPAEMSRLHSLWGRYLVTPDPFLR